MPNFVRQLSRIFQNSLTVKKKHSSLLATGVLIALVIVIVGVVVRGEVVENWRLVDYAPKQTWFYMAFNSDEGLRYLAKKQPLLLRELDDSLRKRGLNQDLVGMVDELALLGVVLEKSNELGWVWLGRLNDPQKLEFYLPKGSFIRVLDTDVVVWSMSEIAMRTFWDSKPKHQSIMKDINQVALWQGFIDLSVYSKSLGGDDKKILNPMLRNLFKPLGSLGWYIEVNEDQLVLNVGGLPKRKLSFVDPLKIDEKTDLGGAGLNLGKILGLISKEVYRIPNLQKVWQQIQDKFEFDYNIEFTDFVELLDREARVELTLQKELDRRFWRDLEKFIESLSTEFMIDFVEPFSGEDEFTVEMLFKNILARKSPVVVPKVLFDGSIAQHLIIQPKSFEFSEVVESEGVKRILSGQSNSEIVLYNYGSGLLVSNSTSGMRRYFFDDSRQSVPVCGQGGTVESVFLSHNILKSFSLLQNFTSVVFERNQTELSVCFQF